MRPTDQAHVLFQTASMMAHWTVTDNNAPQYAQNLGAAIRNTADGLDSLATGLRATYMLLEEVKTLLQRQR
jgi:hypothetical protein